MRLFVAADIDEQTRAQLAPLREAIQRALNRATRAPRVRWVAEANAHVTLRFIGEVPGAIAQAVEDCMREPLPCEPFDVQWDRLGTFPSGRNPRVVWVGLGRGATDLEALATAVNARLARAVGQDEPRPFTAHLTIGRVKETGMGVDWPGALAAAPFAPTVTRVDHVTLYLSRTTPEGPTYTAVRRMDFARP